MPWFEKEINKVNKTSLERPLSIEWCTVVKRLVIHFLCDQGRTNHKTQLA